MLRLLRGEDLAQAHLLALERILSDDATGIFNLGNGQGYSVREVIEVSRQITGKPVLEKIVDRRPGDPAVLIGSNKKAISTLGWTRKYPDLHTIIETAWRWHKNHPTGYTKANIPKNCSGNSCWISTKRDNEYLCL